MTALAQAISALRQNPEQWLAFNESGNVVVLAPPGSGKTQLLTARAASDLRAMGRGPKGAACITMTNEAALEMSRRLAIFGARRHPNVFVGTVHSFALGRIIGPFAAAAGETSLAESVLIDDARSTKLLRDLYSRSPLRDEDFSWVQLTVNRARQRMDLSGDRRLGGRAIAALAVEFSERLSEVREYDFIEMITSAVRLVEEYPWIRKALSACFPRIYVDEYQDLAPGLDRIVRALTLDATAGSSELFAVGDPDQSIYAFSGAYPELLRSLGNDVRTATFSLRINYRSGQGVIDSAIRVLGEDRDVAGQSSGGSIAVYPSPGGPSAQSSRVVELVRSAISGGTPPDEIAVLSSWNADREAATAALRQVGILCFTRAKVQWRSSAATVLAEKLAVWAVRRHSSKIDLSLLLNQLPVISGGRVTHQARVAVVQALLDARPNASAEDFLRSLWSILCDTVRRQRVVDPGFLDMLEAFSEGEPLSGFTLDELAGLAHAPGHVLVATIHTAKGLEFDHVIITGLDESVMPGWNADPAKWAEARRLFYVGITRARHRVDVVYTDSRVSKAGKPYRVKPSPLLQALI